MSKNPLRALTLAAVTVGLAAIGIGAATAALWTPVANPSFRSPQVDPGSHTRYSGDQIPGWTVTRGNVDIIGRAGARTGSLSNALDLNGSERGAVGQRIPVTANQQMTITFRAGRNVYRECSRHGSRSFSVGIAGREHTFRTFQVGRAGTTTTKAAATDDKADARTRDNQGDDARRNAGDRTDDRRGDAPAGNGDRADDGVPGNDRNADDDGGKDAETVVDPDATGAGRSPRTAAEDPQWRTYTYEFAVDDDMASLAFRSENAGSCGAVITDVRIAGGD